MCKNYSTTRMTIHLCLSLSLARRLLNLGGLLEPLTPCCPVNHEPVSTMNKIPKCPKNYNGLRVLGTRTEYGRMICVCTWPNCPWYVCLGPHRLITDTISRRWSPMMSLVRLYRLQIHRFACRKFQSSNLLSTKDPPPFITKGVYTLR